MSESPADGGSSGQEDGDQLGGKLESVPVRLMKEEKECQKTRENWRKIKHIKIFSSALDGRM